MIAVCARPTSRDRIVCAPRGSRRAEARCASWAWSASTVPCATTRRPAAPAAPARTVRHSHVEEPDVQPARPWQLVLMDDDDHSYEYVIEMLGRLFGYGREKAFALARMVDTQGRVALMTGEREACEAKQTQVHAYGADPRIRASKGSMTAVLELLDAPSM